jgi:hypothetical protein
MKKLVNKILGLSLLLVLFACQEDPDIWDSSTVALDGNWYVTYDHESYGNDPFGVGYTPLYTYNTAADNGQEIWLSDDDNFWSYKVRIPGNPEAGTFGSTDVVTSVVDGYEIQVKIENGQIFPDAVKLPSGVMADSIYFEVWFEDLEDATGIANDKLMVSGYRQTGFTEDEH